MTFRVALVGSNQHQNRYAGTDQTEEKWAQRVCAYTRPALARLGFEARIFWVAGAGSSNVDELRRSLDQVDAWSPDLVFSIHSDARGGDNPEGMGILMLAPTKMHTKAVVCGKEIARRMAMANRGVWDYGEEARSIHFLARYSKTQASDAMLAELGEHDGPEEAKLNLSLERAYGEACAAAIAYTYGFPTEEVDMFEDIDRAALRELRGMILALQGDVDRSQQASSYRESIMVALANGDKEEAGRLAGEAATAGFVTGFRL